MTSDLFLYHSLPYFKELRQGLLLNLQCMVVFVFSFFCQGWQPASTAVLLSPYTPLPTNTVLGLQACQGVLPAFNLQEGTAWVGYCSACH